MGNSQILELINRLRWDKSVKPDDYTFYYWDTFARQKFGFKFSEVRLVDGVNLVLRKDGEDISIPTHRVMEVKKGDTYIVKRDVKEL